MWLERITGGGEDLVDLGDAKAHLRILSDETDGEVEAAIAAASTYLDVDQDGFGGLGFPLVDQEWSSKAGSFSASVLRLPFSHVREITGIRFIDPDGVNGVVPPADYLKVRRGRDTVVALVPNKVWPPTASRPDAVDIRFKAGFSSVEEVPNDIIEAAKQLVSYYFHNRGSEATDGAGAEIATCVDRLTRRYRRFAV